MLLLCLMLGNFVGLGSDYLGRWVFGRFFKGRSDKTDWTIFKFLDVKSKEEWALLILKEFKKSSEKGLFNCDYFCSSQQKFFCDAMENVGSFLRKDNSN